LRFADKNVTNFQGFMIKRLKDDKEKVIETTQSIVENVRSNMNNQQRIHTVILRLLEARNFEEFIHIITMDMSRALRPSLAVARHWYNPKHYCALISPWIHHLPFWLLVHVTR